MVLKNNTLWLTWHFNNELSYIVQQTVQCTWKAFNYMRCIQERLSAEQKRSQLIQCIGAHGIKKTRKINYKCLCKWDETIGRINQYATGDWSKHDKSERGRIVAGTRRDPPSDNPRAGAILRITGTTAMLTTTTSTTTTTPKPRLCSAKLVTDSVDWNLALHITEAPSKADGNLAHPCWLFCASVTGQSVRIELLQPWPRPWADLQV